MPGLVGREAELSAVQAFLGDAGGRALAIVGEPGIGKTTVWNEALALARSQDASVLVARPAESEEKLSFAGLTDLLSAVPAERFAELPALQRAALDAALLRVAAATPPDRRLVGAALLLLLRSLAEERPVVLAVDDLQWLDAPSAAAIEFALRRIESLPVQVLVSLRSRDAGGAVMRTLERELAPVRLELGPLSLAALHRILAAELGRTFPRPRLVRIAQVAGGNPLYALEIARAIGRADGRELPVPAGLDALVRERVRTLPAPTRDALLRASALARPDTRAVDARDLAAAEEAGLVRIEAEGRVRFLHPLYASSVYSAASLARRRSTHAALATLDLDVEERARHLALAAAGADPDVVRELEAAARHARDRGAPDSAAELAELALRLVAPAGEDALRLRLDLAEHLYLASDFQHARSLLEELRSELPAGDALARALLTLAEIDYWRSGESVALELAEEALAAAVDPLQRARSLTAIAIYAGTVDLPKAAAAARAALELLDVRGGADAGLAAAALVARVRADLFLGDGFDAAGAAQALALEAAAPPAAVDARAGFRLAQWLRYVDDFDGARARLDEAEQQARDEGDDSSYANILLNRVILETWAGEWESAAATTVRMSDAFDQQGVDATGIAPWRAFVAAHAGRVDEVGEVAGPRPSEPVIAAIWDRCHGLALLATGDVAAAHAHLADAIEGFDRVDFREPAIWRVEGDAIEAAIAAGAVDQGEQRLHRFEEVAARSQIPWSLAVSARCRALVQAGAGELDQALESLDRASAVHERCPVPFELGRTLLVRGQVLRRLKRKRDARTSLERARAIFGELGAEEWQRRVDAELDRVAVRRAPDDLSATELRVARLAAEGLTNQAIADRVFLTRKAVEANLARAYRKLGIRSRAQLALALEAAGANAVAAIRGTSEPPASQPRSGD